jgi:hypothetical protein
LRHHHRYAPCRWSGALGLGPADGLGGAVGELEAMLVSRGVDLRHAPEAPLDPLWVSAPTLCGFLHL